MVQQVAYGVYRLEPGGANAYLVETDEGLALIDCGIAGKADTLAAAIATLGLDEGRIADVLVTHHHFDHVGSLAAIARRTGATVWAPVGDAPFIRGERPPPAPRSTAGRALSPLLARLTPDAEPADVGHEVHDDTALPLDDGSRAVHTPGHTPGHTAFLLDRAGGVLIAGDAVANVGGLRSGGSSFMRLIADDPAAARRSFGRLAQLDFEVAVFGHGAPLLGGAAERFRAAVGVRVD